MTHPDHQQMLRAVGFVLAHGSIEVAAKAAGMNQRLFSSLIERAISLGYLQREEAAARPEIGRRSRDRMVLHIPDLHAPFMAPDAVPFISACIDKFAPTDIVLAGDELDGHAIGRFTPDPNGMSAGDEFYAGLEQLQPLYKLIPEAKVCVSNHGARPFRKAFECGLPSAFLKSYEEFMQAPPGWKWEDEWEIDGTVFSHGESATGANGALQLAIRQGISQACGHWHGVAGASYFHSGRKTVFGLYSGCLISEKAYAFAYGKHSKLKPILGLSIIEDGVPTFIPMRLNQNGNWTGRL